MPNPLPARFGLKASAHQVTVGVVPVRLDTPLGNRTGAVVRNNDPNNTLYVGFDQNVSVATGWPVDPKTKEEFDFGPGITMYGVRSAADPNDIDTRIIEAV